MKFHLHNKRVTVVVVSLLCLIGHSSHAFQHPTVRASRANAANSSPTSSSTSTSPASPLSVGAGGGENSSPPPSQVESIVGNAKMLVSNIMDEKSKDNYRKIFAASVAGLSVSLAMIPEAVAFSFVAGVNPLVGLWTTVVLGFVAASLGGRAGICSSASGACTVVVAALCATHGPAYLSACAVLAGACQVLAGVAGMGKLVRLVPHPVMLGFVNGLAIVMTNAQLAHFKDAAGNWLSLTSNVGAGVYGVTVFTAAMVKLLPMITKAVPPTLGAVAISTMLVKMLKLPVKTLADAAGAATFAGGWAVLPKVGIPTVPFNLQTLKVVLPYAITMASVGCLESLLTMQLLDGIVDDGKRGSTKRECIGQGAGNILSGFTGGIGGCALLGQSIINVQSGGGVSRWSGMSMAVFLACGIVIAAPLLGAVPVASLVGVMLLVSQQTFAWSSLRLLGKVPKLDAFVIALVSIVTVQHDLAVAVLAGTVASALGFAWGQSTSISASTSVVNGSKGSIPKKLYSMSGPLFFGSTREFSSLFQPKTDPDEVVLDFTNSRVMDHSALEAIHTLADQYGSVNKKVYLRHLSKDCAQILTRLYKNGKLPPYEVIEADSKTDPVYGVAANPSLYADVSS